MLRIVIEPLFEHSPRIQLVTAFAQRTGKRGWVELKSLSICDLPYVVNSVVVVVTLQPLPCGSIVALTVTRVPDLAVTCP